MPPRLPVQQGLRRLKRPTHPRPSSACFFCSLSQEITRPATNRRSKRRTTSPRRFESTSAAPRTSDPRKELECVLLELQKHAANSINLSRLHLALNGLRQKPGEESIRVAILGLNSETESSKTAKEVLKLLLADPLKDAEYWEEEIENHNLAQPMIIRVEGPPDHDVDGTISLHTGDLLPELRVSSATLNSHNLEILLAETSPLLPAPVNGMVDAIEDTMLVPAVDVPTSTEGQYTPITTPVHRALVISDGILGAATAASMPTLESTEVLRYAVNIPHYKIPDNESLPFTVVDTNTAHVGLKLIRKSLSNAIEFEHLWFESNIHRLSEWLKADIPAESSGTTKPSVRALIASLLRNTSAALRAEESRDLGRAATPIASAALHSSVGDWAESAHSELQTELDHAFSSRRWRKLGWWKLFWRVDDVGMLTTDILTQRFLPNAEKTSVFLAGRMSEAGLGLRSPQISTYSNELNNVQEQPTIPNLEAQSDASPSKAVTWPTQIPAARTYLQSETVPAFQALAQKLVLQTLSTSGLTTALGALVYVGTLSTTLYEAGAVAALGIVWSMKRMQKQWETARVFWEGEVREEGRKAVKSAEEAMSSALRQESTTAGDAGDASAAAARARAKELVAKGEELLQKLP